MEKMKGAVPADAASQGSSRGVLPNFLLMGAMKSGTTWLGRCLADHPSIYMSPKKELYYFDAEPDKGLAWYSRWFDGVKAEVAIGEATPVYIYDPRAVDSIAGTLPDARLIAILRNPVDRAYSHYCWNKAREDESLTFAEALAAEPERLLGDKQARYDGSYVDRGRYATQLRYILERFPRSSLHVILFEEFRAAPEREYDRVCRFLGVEEGIRPVTLSRRINPHYEFRSRRLRRMTKALPRKGPSRAIRYAMWRVNHRVVSSPSIAPELRDQLWAVLRPEIEELADLLGRDLSCWNT